MDGSEFVEQVRSVNEANPGPPRVGESARRDDSWTARPGSGPRGRRRGGGRAAETLDHWVADRTDGDARGAFEASGHANANTGITFSSSRTARPPRRTGPAPRAPPAASTRTVDRVAAGPRRPSAGRLPEPSAGDQLLRQRRRRAGGGPVPRTAGRDPTIGPTRRRGRRGRLCSDDDRDRAVAAASAVVDLAYDEYAASLEGMGIDPKPVC